MISYWTFEKIWIFNTWGIFLALGFLIPFIFVLRQAKKQNIASETVWNIFLWIVIGSFIGMRLGYILQFSKQYLANPFEILKFWDGGLTFYGGLIGGILGAVFYHRWDKKLSKNKDCFWQIMDLVALYFSLGIITARVGCFLINDHQGAVTNLPWGIIWPDGTIRHPVALYLMLNGLIIFFLLNVLRNKFKKPGHLFFFFLFIYSLIRFFLDFTRSEGTAFSDPSIFSLSYSQWISLIILAVLSFCKLFQKILKQNQ